MRIAILAPGLAYDAGAIPIRARLAGNLLVKRGHQVIGLGLASTRFRKVEADFPIETIPVMRLPFPLASLSCWLAYEVNMAFRLTKLNKQAPLDLVISHWQTYGLTSALVCRWTSAKWVSMVHRTIYDILKSGYGRRNWLMNIFILNGCRGEFRRSTAVIALHQAMMEEIIDNVPGTQQIVTIPNGVHVGAQNFEDLWRQKDPDLVVYVGRLDREKCVDILIRGFAQCDAPEARLVIVGDGEEKPVLQDLASTLNIADRVNFIGALPQVEALGWMKRAVIFVLVSASEGMPFAMVEAMAAGCAIVSSDIDGNRALVSEANAQIVPVGQPEKLALSLNKLVTETSSAKHYGCLAFERAKEFEWGRILEKEVTFYENLDRSTS